MKIQIGQLKISLEKSATKSGRDTGVKMQENEEPVLTKGQQRAVDAIFKRRLIVPTQTGAPYVVKDNAPLRIQTKTYVALKELELLKKVQAEGDKEVYVLNDDGLEFVSGPRSYGTPRRYKR